MAVFVNTNIASISAQNNLAKSSDMLGTSLERLCLRINSAKDDAAGLAISSRFTSQINGMDQAIRNSNDGISLLQTAESSLGNITDMLQRIRDLAVQSGNDTNSASDRASLQKEVAQLASQINDIAANTQFGAGNFLMNGSFTAKNLQVGAFGGETLSFSISNSRATHIGSNTVASTSGAGRMNEAVAAAGDISGAASVVLAGEDLTISGNNGTTTLDIAAGDMASEIASAVNGATSSTGVSATAVTYAKIDNVSAAGTFSFNLYGARDSSGNDVAASISAAVTTGDLTALSDAINAKAATTGITAELSADKASITMKSASGDDIVVENVLDGGTATFDLTGLGADGTTESGSGRTLGALTTTDTSRVAGNLSFSSNSSFSVTSGAAGGMFANTNANNSALSNVASVDISTFAGATNAISVVDGAISSINEQRADLGAITNRLEQVVKNLTSTSENVSAARSRTMDADFAKETATLTKAQIFQQAGAAMLAQANATGQLALSLLG